MNNFFIYIMTPNIPMLWFSKFSAFITISLKTLRIIKRLYDFRFTFILQHFGSHVLYQDQTIANLSGLICLR